MALMVDVGSSETDREGINDFSFPLVGWSIVRERPCCFCEAVDAIVFVGEGSFVSTSACEGVGTSSGGDGEIVALPVFKIVDVCGCPLLGGARELGENLASGTAVTGVYGD
jgi:hypothetical protein